MNATDLTNWLTSAVDTPVSLTAKLKAVFNTAKSKLNTQAEKILNIINTGVKDAQVRYDDAFTNAEGKVFKMNDVANALVQQLQDNNLDSDVIVTSIDGTEYKLDEVISQFNEQNASCGLMQALMSGCESCPTVSDLMRYVENVMGTSITEMTSYAQSALVDFQTTVGQTYADTNPKSRVVQICNWVKNRLQLAVDSQTTTTVLTVDESNYTGACVAAAFLNLIDVEGIVEQAAVAIVNSIKVLATALYNVIDKAIGLVTRGIAKFIQAGSNCAYIQINEKFDIDGFDIPSCQVKFTLDQINDWNDIFPSKTGFKDLHNVFSDGFFPSWTSFSDFKTYLLSTYQVNNGFEIELNFGYVQIFRYSATEWILRVFVTPSEPGHVYKSASGGGWWYDGLCDQGTGASFNFPDFSPAEFLEAQLATDPSLNQKTSNTDWDQMYTGVALHKGTKGGFNRLFASLGSMVLSYAKTSYFHYDYLTERNLTMNYSFSVTATTTVLSEAIWRTVGSRVWEGGHYYFIIGGESYYFTATHSGHIQSISGTTVTIEQSTMYQNVIPALNLIGRYRPNVSGYKYIGPCFQNQFVATPAAVTNLQMLDQIKLGSTVNLIDLTTLRQTDDWYYSFNDLIREMLYLLACTIDTKINDEGYTVGVSVDRVTYGDSRYVLYTDADALKRYSNMVGIVVTAIAVVVIVVVAIIITKKVRSAFYVASAARDTAAFNLGQAVLDGDQAAIAANLTAFKKFNIKSKLLTLLVSGSAVASVHSSQGNSFATMASVSADSSDKLSTIISLIRG